MGKPFYRKVGYIQVISGQPLVFSILCWRGIGGRQGFGVDEKRVFFGLVGSEINIQGESLESAEIRYKIEFFGYFLPDC